MIRLIFPWMMLCCALLSAALAAICAQPYDDGGLRALRAGLSASECALPCFLGIHPGITTQDDAARLLRASPWVADVYPLLSNGSVAWTWSGQQPAFLQGGPGENSLLITNGIVRRIDMETEENLATFVLQFGSPDTWFSTLWRTVVPQATGWRTNLTQGVAYQQYHMQITAPGVCPLTLRDRWALPAQISLLDERLGTGRNVYDRMSLALTVRGEGCG